MGIKHVAGYGESVRRQLEQIGWTQTDLAERSGVSRQTISRALNRDELSDQTAERIAAALGQVPDRPPVRSTSMGAEPRSGERPRRSGAGLCDANDLVAWADRREAESLLPKVIRRLVIATGNAVTEVHFRAGEGVQLSGWDGIVHAEGAAPFVPAGPSGWEIGTGARPRSKAEDDLQKRTKQSTPFRPSDTTLMLVTPRRWEGKEVWARQKTEETAWRRVRVLDADDLETWLETAPGVHAWFSVLIGKIPPDSIDLESFWNEWSGATRPAFTPSLLLAGREASANEIRDHLRQSGRPFAIRSESRRESIAILFAVLSDLAPDEVETVLTRAVVVESAEAFRRLIGSTSPLLLIPTFDADELVSSAARAGHSVVVPLGASDGETDELVQVPPLSRQAAADVLHELGLDRMRAYQLAGLARRSMMAFRRNVASSPGLRQPDWSKPGTGRSLLPALLAGSWNGSTPRDREVLAVLGRRPYEEVRDELIPWAEGSDPAVRRRGEAWYLVSREDAWRLLQRYITSDDLDRFEQVAMTVLGTPHPKFDLPVDQQWMAEVLGHKAEHSGLLARGLAESLAIMGALGDGVPSGARSARDVAENIVRRLLEAANRDWRIWASLSPHLPLLAEAAPDVFLDQVEDGLSGPVPILTQMFTDEKDVVFGSSPHTDLLWALESLAWSVLHIGRVVQVLARLDRIDPGSELRKKEGRAGRLVNRPLASLKAIFRSWLPETSANVDERLVVLDVLRRSEGDVAWAVMLSMLPEHHASASASSRPSFRDWAADARQVATYGEIARITREVISRLRVDAGMNGTRWADLVKHLPMLPPDEHEAVVGDLEGLDVQILEDFDRAEIWSGLRSLVGDHRAFRSANWALPEDRVQRLADIGERFAPTDPVVLYGWLFGHNPHLTDGEDVLESSWESRGKAILSERIKTLESVLSEEGAGVLIRLAEAAKDPYSVGYAAGFAEAAVQHCDEILSHLGSTAPPLDGLAAGFAVAQAERLGTEWVLEQIHRADLGLASHQMAAMYRILPATPETWEMARDRGDEVWHEYWRNINIYRISREHLREASSALIEAGRPYAAVDLLGLGQRSEGSVPPELIADVLDAALAYKGEHDQPSGEFTYSVGELLDSLHKARFDEMKLARLEWALLPALDILHRPPKALHRLLSSSPDFFVEVLSLAYRGDSDEPEEGAPEELSEADQQRARVGHQLLTEWRRIPGQQNGGELDEDHLREWFAAAQARLQEVGRYSIGLHVIGQVFSGSPADSDGSWPTRAVRDLIEDIGSEPLEEGIRIGIYNSRGVVTRDPAAGGVQERALAEKYDGLAAAVSTTHPRTARLLRRIAEVYRRDARREDFESEIGEDLGI